MAIPIASIQQQVANPFQMAMQGFYQGQQQKTQEEALALQEQQMQQERASKAQRQAAMQQALGGLFDSSTPTTDDDILQVMANFPELKDVLMEPYKNKNEEEKAQTFQQIAEFQTMIGGGNLELANARLDKLIAAAENSNKPEDAQMFRFAKEQLAQNPEAAKESLRLQMFALDPDRAKKWQEGVAGPKEASQPELVKLAERLYPGDTNAQNKWIMEQKAKSGQTINIDTGSEVGTIPPGYELFTDPETGARSMRPIAGGPVEGEEQQSEIQKAEKSRSVVASIDNVIDTVNEAVGLTGRGTAGFASLLDFIPESGPRELANTVDTIQANLGFDKLQSMRDASPTGGALGQVSERELNFLQATLANLDRRAKPETLKKNLSKIVTHYQNWRDAVVNARGQELENSGLSQEEVIAQLKAEGLIDG